MIKSDLPIFLASKSPRRRRLLKQLNLKFSAFSVNAEEIFLEYESPRQNALRICKEKMQLAKLKVDRGIIVTCDTLVVIHNEVLGKPKDRNDAFRLLSKLSGKTHTVITAYSIYNSESNKSITNFAETKVTFRRLNESEIWEYIDSGSPMDKAGAYGIQDDFGAVFVSKIDGCYYNVVGLPISKFYKDLLRIVK